MYKIDEGEIELANPRELRSTHSSAGADHPRWLNLFKLTPTLTFFISGLLAIFQSSSHHYHTFIAISVTFPSGKCLGAIRDIALSER